ncbi:hypothetical protein UlMin_011185 [Ulmus minor]
MAESAPTLRVTTKAYGAALNGDWETIKRLYESNRGEAVKPLTVTNDNVLHIAVYSGSKSPVEELLEIVPYECVGKNNDFLNTPLHEAGVIGNVEAARVLVRHSMAELDARNVLGETPLFRSAAFGVTEMVKYLASELGQSRVLTDDIQRVRYDKTSILHIAVMGLHFETALWLLKNDTTLGDLKDQSGRTCLHLLASMPRAFKSGYPMGKLKGWLPIHQIWKEKRKHELALKLSKMLIPRDTSWEETHTKPDLGMVFLGDVKTSGDQELTNYSSIRIEEDEAGKGRAPKKSEAIIPASPTTPLLVATSTGIVEMVEEILKVYPEAIEHVSDKGQNIMHVAIRYRRKEIFSLVKKMMRIPMPRLVRKIDDNGYTLFHHVADMRDYGGGTQPNPALQLQEELQWFESVRELIPTHYELHHNTKDEVAEEFFERSHKELLNEAQNWLKRTAESCSVIAVLIATAAFTAAYTVPGGSDEKTGLPLLLHNPFFIAFTVLDVLSLVSSLTCVVLFIAIVTSPFRLRDFRYSLPRKLTFAFTFLFLSVALMMLAFSVTVLLLVHMKKRWSMLVVYAVAFVPVTVFAIIQFPLYASFVGTLRESLSLMRMLLPRRPSYSRNE